MAIFNFLFGIKTELKVFFVIWLCLFFIFSPVSIGLSLTPKIERQEARAWLANIITDAAGWVWEGILSVWETISDWAISAYEWVRDNIPKILKEAALAALKTLLHQILAKVTNSIVQWIQSDFHGKPGFITDFDDYMRGAVDAAAGKFLQGFFGTRLCSPFAVSLKMAINLPVPTFDTRATCTLSDIVDNVEDFYADFTNGGWVAWKASLEPNNNAFGTMLMALNEKAAQEFAAQQKAGAEAPRGFKPTKKCMSATKMTKVPILNETKTSVVDVKAGVEPVADPSKIDPDSADCSSAMVTAPDGTVEFTTNFSATSAMRSLEAEMSNLMGTGAGATFTPYIMAITNALITKLVDKSMTGLLGAISQGDRSSGTNLPTYDPATDPTLFDQQISGIQSQSNEYENIMYDLAESEKVKANLDSAEMENIATTAKNSYDGIVDKINLIKSKQLSVIVDFWSEKKWGDEATIEQTKISTTTIEYCSGSPITCSIVATPPATTSMDITNYVLTAIVGSTTQIKYCSVSASTSSTTCNITTTLSAPISMANYVRSTTNTNITNLVSHSKIGKAPIVETTMQITDTRTDDPGNFDIDGNRIANYNSSNYSYSLQSPRDPIDNAYKCQSEYSPSTIICQIDVDDTDPSSDFYELQSGALTNIPALISSAQSALASFVNAANAYGTEFQKDSSSCADTGSACATARTSAVASKETVISALQALTGDTSSTTITDLNGSLTKLVTDTASASGATTIVTINNPDGTQTKEDAENYYLNYFNDVVVIYNELAAL